MGGYNLQLLTKCTKFVWAATMDAWLGIMQVKSGLEPA